MTDIATTGYTDSELEDIVCTCGSDADWLHPFDCDLWVIPSFINGDTCWDSDRGQLVLPAPGAANPDAEFIEMSLRINELPSLGSKASMVPDPYGACGCKVPAILYCGWCDVWKGSDGKWYSVEAYLNALQVDAPGATVTDTTTTTDTDDSWEYAQYWGYGATSFGGSATAFAPKCRHYGAEVVFPDGTKILASSCHKRKGDEDYPVPTFGGYMYDGWDPTWLSYNINWVDFGLPKLPVDHVIWAAESLVAMARDGEIVEIGCMGGHGRTGTLMACMATLCGVPVDDANQWVWDNYCKEAIEGERQEWYVQYFDAVRRGIPLDQIPPEPAPPKPVTVKGGSSVGSVHSVDDHKSIYMDGKTCTRNAGKPCTFWDQDLDKHRHAWDALLAEKKAPKDSVLDIVNKIFG